MYLSTSKGLGLSSALLKEECTSESQVSEVFSMFAASMFSQQNSSTFLRAQDQN